MTDHLDDLKERYSRQTRLPAFGNEAQQRLIDARVLIIGMGGLGSPASLYLASAGVGMGVVVSSQRCCALLPRMPDLRASLSGHPATLRGAEAVLRK